MIAISIGTIEVLGCLQEELGLEGGIWDGVETINDNFEYVGYTIIGFFAISGAVAAATWAVRSRRTRPS